MRNNRLVELPDYGRLIAVSDLHGNFRDYKRYLKLWDEEDCDCHIVFMGDLIHAMGDEDGSVEILEDAMYRVVEYPNFHCLLGNHEWSHIVSKDIFKAGVDIREEFERLIIDRKGYLEPSLTGYVGFFKSLPYFLRTSNGIFISHAGPSRRLSTADDFVKLCRADHYSSCLHDFLWSRFASSDNGYAAGDVDSFLNAVNSKYMVVGHTVVDSGYKIIGNQMILSSSFYTSSKSYLDIDLSKDYDSIEDLIKDIRIMNNNI